MAHMDKNEVTAQKLSELSRSETKEAHCAWDALQRSTDENNQLLLKVCSTKVITQKTIMELINRSDDV